MKKSVFVAVATFGITLAVIVAQRLSDQTMAVIAGSVIGVAASVPMTAIVLWLVLRQREGMQQSIYRRSDYAPQEESPRIMVIQPQPYTAPPAAYQQSPPVPYLQAPSQPYMRPPRDFKIVGQEDFEDEDRHALV